MDKLISCRFKKWDRSWRPEGALCMCQIIEIKENGELPSFLSKKSSAHQKEAQVAMDSLRKVRKEV